MESFKENVEVKTVFPGQLGGCVFFAVPKGFTRSIPFFVKYTTTSRIPCTGERWEIKGHTMPHEKHRHQVIVEMARFLGLPTDDYVVNFLGKHPSFRGFNFGPGAAKRLSDDIGASELIKLLNDGNWQVISEARVTESIAQRICEEWHSLKEETEVVSFLSEHKLGGDIARKVVRLCKYNTVERLKRNPYSLVALSNCKNTRNFKLINTIARKLDIDANDDRSLIGCVEQALYRELHHGHTITDVNAVKKSIQKLLKLIGSDKSASDALNAALAERVICIYDEDDTAYIQPVSLAFIEQGVEKALVQLNKEPMQDILYHGFDGLPHRIDEYSAQHEIEHGWGFVDKQKAAIHMALISRFSLLSGYGGTGKTAVLKAVYNLAKERGTPVFVAALAGKAANRAKESIGADIDGVSTIHTMIAQMEKGSKFGVQVGSDPLIIIDEASMVDISLMFKLIRLFNGNPFRLLLVGDSAQLPPIGFGLFWHKLVNSNALQTQLTEVHRTVGDSPLHKCAMKVRNGEPHKLPVYQGESEGVFLLPSREYLSEIIKLRHTFDDMIVLTSYASKTYESSTSSLNPAIQANMNPWQEGEHIMKYGSVTIHKNDPVLVTNNSHKLGLFNGMTGVITNILPVDGKTHCIVEFDGISKPVELTREQCWEVRLELAYLMTIHKSQGSEYPNAAIIMDSPFLERSALYTAITRTKKLCILIGTNEQYNQAILRQPTYETIRSAFNPVF